jgi:hypothetical protein
VNCATDLRGSKILARVDFSSVTDAENEHYEPSVFDGTDDAIVSHAIFPELTQCSLQPFADLMWAV